MINPHAYCVILAGGIGERLWPLSRQQKPKQFLEIQSDQTLLDHTIERMAQCMPCQNIVISTTQHYQQTIKNLCGNRIGDIIIEPSSKNTGPAILLACCQLQEKDPEAIVFFLSADAFIPQKDNKKFAHYVEHAIDFAFHNNQILLFGAKPTYDATGYGYIQFDPNSTSQPSSVKKFHEKPSRTTAQVYLDDPSMLWNIGMFCAKSSIFIDEYKQLAPKMFQDVINYKTGKTHYDVITSNSIDYAILEKSNRVSVLPIDFAWSDIGSLETYLSIKNMFGSLDNANVFSTESYNNIVDVPGKLVALIGVSDVCIVETDKVLLITKRQDLQKIHDIVKQVKQRGLSHYL